MDNDYINKVCEEFENLIKTIATPEVHKYKELIRLLRGVATFRVNNKLENDTVLIMLPEHKMKEQLYIDIEKQGGIFNEY